MAKQIKYGVSFNADTSGLKSIKTQLQELKKLSVIDLQLTGEDAEDQLARIRRDLDSLSEVWDRSFNKDLGTVNISKLHKGIQDTYGSLGQMQARFSALGTQGERAFRDITISMLSTQRETKKTFEWMDKLANTFANTLRWTISSAALNTLTGSIQQAYHYAVDLDTSLNDIRIVTGKSADEMERFARIANKAAKSLGSTTKEYTEASLIYYQQGLSDREAQARAGITLKAANVTGQSAQEVSEQLTAVWNGYKVSAQEAEQYVDKLAAVAATTAADLEELSVGMSKVASAANSMGVDVNQLSAQLATIISVTRQAPEAVGTALKTIYARMGDLQLGETDEDGVALGDVSSQLAQVGIQVLDATGNLRDMGAVTEEVAAKWNTWTEAQQQAVAIAMAGKRQYNNLIALFENWDMYEDSLSTSVNSMGTLQKQQDTYMESTEAHLQKLTAAMEGIYDSLFNQDEINGVLNALTSIATSVETLIDSLGGGSNILLLVSSLLTNISSAQISAGIMHIADHFRITKENAAAARVEIEMLAAAQGMDVNNKYVQRAVKNKETLVQYERALTDQQKEYRNALIQSTLELAKQEDIIQDELSAISSYITSALQKDYKLKIDVDSEDAVAEIEKVKEEFAQIRETLSAGSDQVSKMGVPTEAEIHKAATEWEKAYAEYSARSSRTLSEDVILDRFKSGGKLTAAQKELYASYEASYKEIFEKSEKVMQDLQKRYAESDKGIFSEADQKAIDALIQKYNALDKASQQGAEGARLSAEVQKQYQAALKRAGIELEKQEAQTEKTVGQTKALKRATEEYTKAQEEADKAARMQNTIAAITKSISLVTTMISTVNMLRNAFSAFNDSSLSDWEKWSQILIGIISAIVTIIETVKSINTIVTMLNKNLTLKNVIDAISIALHKKDLELRKAQLKNEQDITKEKKKQAIIDAVNNQANKGKPQMDVSSRQTIQAGSQRLGSAGLKRLGTQTATSGATNAASAVKNAGIAKGASAATTGLASGLAAALPVIIGVGATLAALIAVIYFTVKAWNKQADAAKAAREEAEKLSKAYENIRVEYDKLKESVNNYKDLREGLDDLVEGTREWKEALMESNNQVLELLDKYPELINYIERAENGALTISEVGLDNLLDSQLEQVGAAERALYAGNIKSAKADYELSAIETSRKVGLDWWNTDEIKKVLSVYQGNEEAFRSTDALVEALKSTEVSYLSSNKQMVQKLVDNVDALDKLSLELSNTELSIETQRRASAQSWLIQEGGTSYQNNQFKEALTSAVAKATGEGSEAREQAILRYAGMSENKLKEAYAALSGYELKNGKLYSGDEEVEWNKEAAKTALIEEAAFENLSGQLENLNLAVYKLANSYTGTVGDAQVGKTAFASFAGGAENADLSSLIYGQLENVFDLSNLTEENAKDLGYESLSELESAINTAIANYKDRFNEAFKDAPSILPSKDDAIWQKMSLAQIENLVDVTSALAEHGQEATYSALMEATEDDEELMQIIANINWEEQGAAKAFRKAILDNDLEIGEDALDNFIRQVEIAEDTLKNFSVKDFVKDFTFYQNNLAKLEQGGILDKATWEELTSELQAFFNTTADGQKILAGSTEEFHQKAKDTYQGIDHGLEDQRAKIEDTQREIAQRQNAINDGYADVSGEKIVTTSYDLLYRKRGYDSTVNSLEYKFRTAGAPIDVINTILDVYRSGGGNLSEEQYALVKDAGYASTLSGPNKSVFAEAAERAKKQVAFLEASGIEEKADGLYSRIYGGTASISDYELLDSIMSKYSPEDFLPFQVQAFQDQLAAEKETLKTYYLQNILRATSSNELQALLGGAAEDFGADSTQYQEIDKAIKQQIDTIVATFAGEMGLDITDIEDIAKSAGYNKDYILEYIEEFNRVDKKFKTGKESLERFGTELDNLKNSAENLTGVDLLANFAKQEAKSQDILDIIKYQQSNFSFVNGSLYSQFRDVTGDYSFRASGDEDGSQLFTWENYLRAAEAGADDTYLEAFKTAVEDREHLIALQEQYNEELQNMPTRRINAVVDALAQARDSYLAMLEFEREYLEEDDFASMMDSFVSQAEAYLANGEIQTRLQNITSLLAQDDLTEEQRNRLIQEQEDLIEIYGSVEGAIESAYETYYEAITNVTEATEKQNQEVQQLNDLYDYQLELMELLGKRGEEMYSISNLYSQKQANYMTQLGNIQNAINKLQEEKVGATEEEQAKINEQIITLANSYQDIATQAVQSLKDGLEAATRGAFEDLFGDLEAASEEWDLLSKSRGMALDEINKAYELRKLERKYEESISAANGVSAQAKLNKLREDELAMLRQKDKLTKYDIDRANLSYELALKQIALEEAQQNKSKMRLTRDASGNYSYQFVSDESAISKAQQEVDDLQNQIYNLDVQTYESGLSEILSLTQEFEQKYIEILSSGLEGEELEIALQNLTSKYNDMFDILGDQNVDIVEKLQGAVADFDAIWGDSSAQALISSIMSDGGLSNKTSGLVANSLQQAGDMANEISSILGNAEEKTGLFGVMDQLAAAVTAFTDNNDLTSALEKLTMSDENLDNLQRVEDHWNAIKTDIEDAVKAVAQFNALSMADTFEMYLKNYEDDTGITSDSGAGKYASNVLGPLFNQLIAPYEEKYREEGSLSEREKAYVKALYEFFVSKLNGADLKHLTAFAADGYSVLSSFDTGGYTGEWGPDGRLAMLHEKEIVLNKDDTENFLYALDAARAVLALESELLQAVRSQSISARGSLAMASSLSQSALEQTVEINANFPSVSDRYEIEAAFEELLQMAAQAAYRNNR